MSGAIGGHTVQSIVHVAVTHDNGIRGHICYTVLICADRKIGTVLSFRVGASSLASTGELALSPLHPNTLTIGVPRVASSLKITA